MAEETPTPSSEPAPSPAPSSSPLEKVYSDFKIEEQAAEFKPQPQAPVAPQPVQQPRIPDPFDPQFQAYQAQMQSGLTVLGQALSQTKGELTNLQRQLTQQRTEADIKQAVGVLSEKSGLDPVIAEVAFEAQARKDPRLLSIWNNRQKNPAALTAALGALATEFQGKFTVKQDPQLVENQRAVQASRNQMATTSKSSQQDEWSGMSPVERQAKVQALIRRGS